MACQGCRAGTKTNCCWHGPFPWAGAHGPAVSHQSPAVVNGCGRGTRRQRVMRQGRFVWVCLAGNTFDRYRIVSVAKDTVSTTDAMVTTRVPHGLQAATQVVLSGTNGNDGTFYVGFGDGGAGEGVADRTRQFILYATLLGGVPSSPVALVGVTTGGIWQLT